MSVIHHRINPGIKGPVESIIILTVDNFQRYRISVAQSTPEGEDVIVAGGSTGTSIRHMAEQMIAFVDKIEDGQGLVPGQPTLERTTTYER